METSVLPACKQNSAWLQDRVAHGFIGTGIAVHTTDACYRCILFGKKCFISCFIMWLVLSIIRMSMCKCKINCINCSSSLKNISPQKAGTGNHILLRLRAKKLLTCEEFRTIHCQTFNLGKRFLAFTSEGFHLHPSKYIFSNSICHNKIHFYMFTVFLPLEFECIAA